MFGEIYLCRFPFTDGQGFKLRPALVLFDLGEDALICRVTGRLRSGPMDVVIAQWQAAGLVKSSIARLDRIITAEKSIFLRRLGCLSPADLEVVRMRWNTHMRL